MNKRELGSIKEEQVCKLLEQYGYIILECNYRVRQGEIDIIARQEEYLVFMEVKYRSSTSYGTAIEAVDYRKCQQISKVALYYMKKHNITEEQAVRFDVAAMDGENVTIVPNAFDFCY